MDDRIFTWFIAGMVAGLADIATSMVFSKITEVLGLHPIFTLIGIFGLMGMIIVALTKGSWLVKETIYFFGYLSAALVLKDYLTIFVIIIAITILVLRKTF